MNDKENIVDFQVQSGSENEDEELNEVQGISSSEGAEYSDDLKHTDTSNFDDDSEDNADTDEFDDTDESDDDSDETEEADERESHGMPFSSLRGVLGNKTLEDVIEREAKEEQDNSSPFSLSRTLGGVIISRFVRRQMGVVLLIGVFIIIYISLRYMCQKRLVEIDKTETRIVNARYKATVCTSQLTEASRESNVLKRLAECGDSTLTIADEPPYLIKIEDN